VLLPPLVAVLLAVSADPFPQPADDQGEHGKSGQRPECSPHGFSPRTVICVDNGSLPSVLVTAASVDRSRAGAYGRAAVIDGFPAQAVVARLAALDLA
jgi:hypothetical protein